MVRRHCHAACSPKSGYEQTSQTHISTSTCLQCVFKHTALDALDTLKLPLNAPSNVPSVHPQMRPQHALNTPSKGSNVLSMHPHPQCPQHDPNTPLRCPSCTPIRYVHSIGFMAKTYKYYSSPLPPTGMHCIFLCAILGCDMTPLVPLHPGCHFVTTSSLSACCVLRVAFTHHLLHIVIGCPFHASLLSTCHTPMRHLCACTILGSIK